MLAAACSAGPTPHVKSIVLSLAEKLEENYVFEDKALAMREHLLSRMEAGAFDGDISDDELAALLHQEIRSIADDKHLRVVFANAPPAQRRRQVSASPYGFGEARLIEGRVGYLEITNFHDPTSAHKAELVRQLKALVAAESIILDLRNNGGGSPESVQLISSYFFDRSHPIHLNTLYFRNRDLRTDFYTLTEIEGPDLKDKRLFLLTSDYTFSAAEEFAYNLKVLRRATLVGETTAGGAHPVNRYMISDDIVAIIPVGRAINPVTQTNWETVGVEPDVKTDEAGALQQAVALALRR